MERNGLSAVAPTRAHKAREVSVGLKRGASLMGGEGGEPEGAGQEPGGSLGDKKDPRGKGGKGGRGEGRGLIFHRKKQ